MLYSLGLGHSFNLPFGILKAVNKERKYRNHVTACSTAFCTLLLEPCFQMSVQSCCSLMLSKKCQQRDKQAKRRLF